MNIRVSTTEQRIARRIQSRLRHRGVYVHNMLVRAIVRIAMDMLVELPRLTRERLMEAWLEGKNQTSENAWSRSAPWLAKAYTEEAMRAKGFDFNLKIRHMKGIHMLTGAEFLALEDARLDAVRRGDANLASAATKAIRSLYESAPKNRRKREKKLSEGKSTTRSV